MIAHGADLTDTSALIWATCNDESAESIETMAFLLDAGVDINHLEHPFTERGLPLKRMDRCCGTALHHAAYNWKPEKVRFLLERGADRNIKGWKGLTALEAVQIHSAVNEDLIEVLEALRGEWYHMFDIPGSE
jgi:hypothetical protein